MMPKLSRERSSDFRNIQERSSDFRNIQERSSDFRNIQERRRKAKPWRSKVPLSMWRSLDEAQVYKETSDGSQEWKVMPSLRSGKYPANVPETSEEAGWHAPLQKVKDMRVAPRSRHASWRLDTVHDPRPNEPLLMHSPTRASTHSLKEKTAIVNKQHVGSLRKRPRSAKISSIRTGQGAHNSNTPVSYQRVMRRRPQTAYRRLSLLAGEESRWAI